jgi:hypothetical protein
MLEPVRIHLVQEVRRDGDRWGFRNYGVDTTARTQGSIAVGRISGLKLPTIHPVVDLRGVKEFATVEAPRAAASFEQLSIVGTEAMNGLKVRL